MADLHLCIPHHWDKQSRHTFWPLKSGANSLPCKHQTWRYSVVFKTPKMAVTTSLAPPSLTPPGAYAVIVSLILLRKSKELRISSEAAISANYHQRIWSREKKITLNAWQTSFVVFLGPFFYCLVINNNYFNDIFFYLLNCGMIWSVMMTMMREGVRRIFSWNRYGRTAPQVQHSI